MLGRPPLFSSFSSWGVNPFMTVLEGEVRAWQKREQLWQVGGKLTPQISLEKAHEQVEVRVL